MGRRRRRGGQTRGYSRSHRGGRGDVPRGEKPAQKRGRGGAVGIAGGGSGGSGGGAGGAGEAGRGKRGRAWGSGAGGHQGTRMLQAATPFGCAAAGMPAAAVAQVIAASRCYLSPRTVPPRGGQRRCRRRNAEHRRRADHSHLVRFLVAPPHLVCFLVAPPQHGSHHLVHMMDAVTLSRRCNSALRRRELSRDQFDHLLRSDSSHDARHRVHFPRRTARVPRRDRPARRRFPARPPRRGPPRRRFSVWLRPRRIRRRSHLP